MNTRPLQYRRVLLKLSGEALMGRFDYGIDPEIIHRIAAEVIEVNKAGAQIGLVIGGGNIFRGAGLAAGGMDRVTGDHMGMLATIMNALAMQDALEKQGAYARVMSAVKINAVAETTSVGALCATWRKAASRFLPQVPATPSSIRNPILKKSIDSSKILIYDGKEHKISF